MTYIKILIAVSGLAFLTACGGGGVTISATDVATLEAELRKAKTAQRDAENARDAAESARKTTETAIDVAKSAQEEAERLRGQAEISMTNAVSAQLKANKEITRLKNELDTAIGERNSARNDKNAANLRVRELEGELQTAIGNKNTADAEVLRLTGDLETLTRAKESADAEVLRLTQELETVTGDKNTAESERDTARDERDKARTAEITAKRLQGNAETAQANAERLLGVAELAKTIAEIDKTEAERLQGLAEAAKTEADRLRGIAEAAKTEADRLRGIAETDRDTALDEKAEAERLQGVAELAKAEADRLKGIAELAKTNAETDKATAERLQREAETAKAEADRLRGIAEAAKTEAERLQGIAESDRDTARDDRDEADRLRGVAELAKTEAERLKSAAELAKTIAEIDKTEAERLQGVAEDAKTEADRLRGIAEAAKTEAERLQGIAESDRDNAQDDRDEADRLRGVAELAKTEADRLRGLAELAKTEAETDKETAERLQREAETAKAEADRLRGLAELAKTEAERLQGIAETDRDNARDERDEAERLQGEAETAKAEADRLKREAETAKRNAETDKAEAERLQGIAEAAKVEAERLQGIAETDRDTAQDERDKAERLQGVAELAKTEAERLQGIAEDAKTNAEIDKAEAERLQGVAEDAKTEADRLRGLAEAAKTEAERLQGIAETDRDNALNDKAEAERLRGIAELAKTKAETDKAEAERLQGVAEDAKTEADRLRGIAESAKTEADRLRGIAEAAKTEAERLQGIAESDRDTAQDERDEADRLRGIAELAKTKAETDKAEAERLKGIAEAAKTEADRLRGIAEAAKTEAERLQGIAETDRDNALNDKAEAERLRGIAEDAETEAERLRGIAELAKTEAETDKTEAERLKGIAEAAKTEADRLRGIAEAAKTEAERLQGIAETDRDNALNDKAEAERLQGVAEDAKAEAERLRGLAETAKTNAETDKAEAQRLQGIAEDAKTEADRLRGIAEDAKTEAERLQGIAETDRDTARDERDEAQRLQGIAEDAKAEAERLKGLAETAKTNAETDKAEADRLRGIAEDAKTEADRLRRIAETAKTEADRLRGIAETERDNALKDLEAANKEITRLDRFIRPTYANWKLAVNPETVPNVISPQNQFLQADEDSISTEGTTAVPKDVQTLNLLTATFDGLPLDGEAVDGVAFFNAGISGARSNYNYAGVFSGTDLGAPITRRAGTKAIWYGSFDHTLNPSKDFALTITFNKTGGTLDAFVSAGIANNHFIFDDVRFDTRGLITGEVLYISFSQNGRTAITSTKTATLRGLIGQQGAVGVFVGEKGSNSNIGGGFVAHPTATLDSNKINFADWGGVDGDPKPDVPNADNTPLLYGVASVGNSNPAGNFIHGLAISPVNEGFNFVGTPFASATVTGDVLYMGEDGTSGAAFSRVRGAGVTGVKYYAGLLPTTDLGVPITAKDLSVTWDAKFTLNSDGGAFVNPNFKIRVRFNGNGGTINSGTPAGNGFTNGGVRLSSSSSSTITIQGKFGRDGVLYGTVGNGTLTGLIGVNGAVGAFVGATLAGGFVAYPNAARTINAADWGGTAGDPKTTVINKDDTGTDPLLNGFESVVNIGPEGNFIQGLPTVAGKGFNFAGTAFSDEDVYGDVLLLDEGSSSGVAFSHVRGTGTRDRYYAGLLSSTNLGAPIDTNASAIWNAQFRAVLSGVGSDIKEYSHLGFKMRITYNGSDHISTINSGTVSNGVFTKGSVTVPYTNITSHRFNGSNDFSIQGKFGDDGLLYGTVNLGRNIEATLTGLVGVNGAVGAFVGGGGGVNIAGGFVAHPIATVNFVNWAGFSGNRRTTVINKDNTGTLPLLYGAASVVDSGPRVNFIQRFTPSAGKGFDFTGTAFRKASVRGEVLYLDKDKTSGSGVAFSQVSATDTTGERYYAGLLLGTNLGSRITDPTTSTIWDAELMGVFKTSNPQRYSSRHFKMQVIFDGNKGTISSGTYSGGVFTKRGIPTDSFGNFNIQGKFGRDGLLYGTVGLRSNTNGTLTGLIGADGAVGVFAFNATGIISYVGGFVAHPIGEVNFASWGGAVGEPKATITAGINEIITSKAGTAPLLNGFASVSNDNPTGNFIQGLDTLDGQGFDFARTGFPSASVTGGILYLDEDSNSGSGVAFSHVRGTGVTRDKYYAGLLSATDLGLPIADPNTSAIWDARLMGVFKIFSPQQYSNLDFKMQVIFDGNEGTISSGTVSGGSFTPGEISTSSSILGDFNIEGRFDHDGLLYGTVGTTDLKGTLTGLIGQAGAVGAFAFSSNAVSYVGGFVATPPSE
ncbi:MAG: hypothetical protein ACNYPD_08360 [Candidatus Halichondribacter symbioticus]